MAASPNLWERLTLDDSLETFPSTEAPAPGMPTQRTIEEADKLLSRAASEVEHRRGWRKVSFQNGPRVRMDMGPTQPSGVTYERRIECHDGDMWEGICILYIEQYRYNGHFNVEVRVIAGNQGGTWSPTQAVARNHFCGAVAELALEIEQLLTACPLVA